MEWHLKIPKILHVYWGGGPLNYLRYMTIKSFMNLNPDWKIIFLYPKYPTARVTWFSDEQKYSPTFVDFLPEVMRMPIEKVEINFLDYGFDNHIPEVHKSDFIRLEQLSTMGGVWSDMDIFYVKPMSSLYFNTPENKHIQTVYCNQKYGPSVGFLMATENNKFFKSVKEIAKKEYSPYLYQSIGAIVYLNHFSTHNKINSITPAVNLEMDVVYPYDAHTFPELLIEKTPRRITNRTIGIHWYGGSAKWADFLSKTNGGRENLPNNIIGNLLRHAR